MKNCDKRGCLRPAAWSPCLLLYVPTSYHCPEPIHAALNLGICDECSGESKAEDFISEEGWEQICDSLKAAGKVRPDRKLTKIAWLPLGAFNSIRADGALNDQQVN